MTDPPVPTATDELGLPGPIPEALVPGINPMFLRDRSVIPLSTDEGKTRWGMADPTDPDTLAALRFASRTPIDPVALPESTIRALLDESHHAARRRIAPKLRTSAVPHADAVIALRSYIVEAIAASADHIEIMWPAGTLSIRKAARDIATHEIGTATAEALVAAAVALASNGHDADNSLGVDIHFRGTRTCVTIEPLPTGVVLVLKPIGPA